MESYARIDNCSTNVPTKQKLSDPDAAARRGKLKQLKRQLSNLRRKMEEMELTYQSTHGYRPSQVTRVFARKALRISPTWRFSFA